MTYVRFTYTIRDAKGKIGYVRFWTTFDAVVSANGVIEDIMLYSALLRYAIDYCIYGVIESVNVSFDAPIVPPEYFGTGFAELLPTPLKTVPNSAADIEEKAKVTFPKTASSPFYQTEIPTFRHDRFIGTATRVTAPLTPTPEPGDDDWGMELLWMYAAMGSNQDVEWDSNLTDGRGDEIFVERIHFDKKFVK